MNAIRNEIAHSSLIPKEPVSEVIKFLERFLMRIKNSRHQLNKKRLKKENKKKEI